MFDVNKIKSAAEQLGLEIEFDTENPGMQFITPDGQVEHYLFSDLRSELALERVCDEFTKE